MNIHHTKVVAEGLRFSVSRDGAEVGRAYLYLMMNDLHEEPFGFLEDVFVEESARGDGVGKQLVNEVIAAARTNGCYKLIATSRDARPRVHALYVQLGFADYGREFRMNLAALQ
ncbi:MAG: GNAT family N-acetyltransferase [Pseudomonadota bacterium]